MRTYDAIRKEYPRALIPKDVFAAYYTDGADEEWLYFKLIPWHTLRGIVRALQEMRVFAHYRLEKHEEEYRNGYVNEKFCLRMLERDEALIPLPDLKRITSELTEAMGFTLHWIPINRMLNFKIRKI